MARCPFAEWRPISGSSGPHQGGPYKIVHHTTEGSTAAGAMAAFARNRSDPHFTVDAQDIFQHIDTNEGARALRNAPGGVQTNRDSAVQIELVGFAHLPKDPKALKNLARLCRWIESVHGVPKVWPSGPPKPAKNGMDPGGHNRDAATWDAQGGHYGHCHVPENTHWDPAYLPVEADFVLNATFDASGRLTSAPLAVPAAAPTATGPRRAAAPERGKPPLVHSTMPGHTDVTGVRAYLQDLPLLVSTLPEAVPASRLKSTRPRRTAAPATPTPLGQPAVNVGSLLSFVDGISAQERDDVLFSVQLAQRGASGRYDRFSQTRSWYQTYLEILENLGWAAEQMAFTRYDQGVGEFRMDKAALAVIAAIATQSQLAVLQEAVKALENLAQDETLRLFDFHSSLQSSGNFQLGALQKSDNGALSMALGAFYFRSADERRSFLFWKWGAQQVNFWTAAHRMTLNQKIYDGVRADVQAKLSDGREYIRDLTLGKR